MAKWYNEKENEEIIKKIEEIKGDVSAFAKESIDTSLSAMDKAQNARIDQINESIEHLSNDYFTSKNKVNFRIIETDNNFKLCSTEILSIREEIDDIYLKINAVNSKIDKLFLLIGLVGFAVLGDILWTLINL